MKQKYLFMSGLLSVVSISLALAETPATKRVAIHYAGSNQSTYYNLGSEFYIEHGESDTYANGGKHTITVHNGNTVKTFPAGSVDLIKVQNAAAPTVTLSAQSGWKVLYGAQETCGINGWSNLIDGNIGSRVSTPIYPGYNNSPELGNYYWVIDLGEECEIASVSADFLGGGAGASGYDCMPQTLNIYGTTVAPGTLPDDVINTLSESTGDPLAEKNRKAVEAMNENDAKTAWSKIATASYSAQAAGLPALKAVTDAPATVRYVKVEVVPFSRGTGDRCFVHEIYVEKYVSRYTSVITDKSAWNVVYGAQNTCGESSWNNLIDGNNGTRVATPIYPGYNNNPGLGNYFWVIDLGSERSIISVSADFRGVQDPYDCTPSCIKVYATNDTPEALTDEDRSLLQASASDPLDEDHKAAYNRMKALAEKLDWREIGIASYSEQKAGLLPLKVETEEPVSARYIKVEVVPFEGKTGDRCFLYDIDVEQVDDDPDTVASKFDQTK